MRRIAFYGMVIALVLLATIGVRHALLVSADASAAQGDWYATFEYNGNTYAFSHAYTELAWTTVVGSEFATAENYAPDGNAGQKGQAWCNQELITEGSDNAYDDWFLPNFDEMLAGRNTHQGGDPLAVTPPSICHTGHENAGLRALWTSTTCYEGAFGAERAYFLYPLSSRVVDDYIKDYAHCENDGADSHWCCFTKQYYGRTHTCPLVRCVRVISDDPSPTDTPVPPTPTDTPEPTPTETPTPSPTATPGDPQVVLRLAQVEATAGSRFAVPLTVENVTALERWTATISYDPNLIAPTGAVTYTWFADGEPGGLDFEEGTISLSEDGAGEALSGAGVLAFVEFHALQPGAADLIFGETALITTDGWQAHAARDGSVTVLSEPDPTETPTPTEVFEETLLTLPDLQVAHGSVFSVPVAIDNAAALESWVITFSYDPAVITPTTVVTLSGFLSGYPLGPVFEEGELTLGEFTLGWAASGDGALAFVEFAALAPGTSPLTFEDSRLIGSTGLQPHRTRDGSVAVVELLPPTDTPVPPTDTPVPPTDTPAPPTDTPPPPTDTPAPPTDTPVPPIDTPAPPTDTPVPPTDTPAPPTDTPAPPPDTPTHTATPPDSPIETPTLTPTPPESPILTPTPTYPPSPLSQGSASGTASAAALPLLGFLVALVTWGSAGGGWAAAMKVLRQR